MLKDPAQSRAQDGCTLMFDGWTNQWNQPSSNFSDSARNTIESYTQLAASHFLHLPSLDRKKKTMAITISKRKRQQQEFEQRELYLLKLFGRDEIDRRRRS
ncbi:proline-tRNA ligase [Striga asiatica]|uniref:Proline-tRNA ligase n=1 Tax=Striga asiatica TaxID=4170 RepID=A0A5A7Q6E1_STRAF|nr:proline-tRNA ligase [Striga asiatica]